MAEAKRQAEKKLKREQRMMKMMQQQQQQQEQLEATDQQQLSGGGGSEEPPPGGQESNIGAKRILETIQDEEEAEARVLQEALTSIPEPDEPEDATMKGREGEMDSSIKKGGGKTKVHYISLKPLTKKERKRQQRMAAEIAAAEAELKEEEQADDWTPPSPVALPDASTVKPVLVQLGFQLASNERKELREKKSLRYADGILPGQGSPEPYDVPSPPPSAPSPKPGKVAAPPKKRKRIKIKVIQFKTKADIEADRKRVPPPPPPGDPPLMKHQEFIDNYAYKGTLPKHLMALVATA